MKRWILISHIVILSFAVLSKCWGENDPLTQDTKDAQARIQKWDEDNRTIEKKENWEIPVVSALAVVGVVFYEGGRTAGYVASGVAAGGLTIRFWPFHHHRTATEKPSN